MRKHEACPILKNFLHNRQRREPLIYGDLKINDALEVAFEYIEMHCKLGGYEGDRTRSNKGYTKRRK